MDNIYQINYTLIFSRILAMFLILACHAASWMGLEALEQVLCVGVPIFFFISGYIYGNKVITSAKQFLKKRFYRIYVPLWRVIIPIWILELLNQRADIKDIVPYFIGIHGMNHWTGFWPRVGMPITGSGHLWFLTIIFICYGILLIFHGREYRLKKFFLIAIILLPILAVFEIYIHDFIAFFTGYFMSKRHVLQLLSNKVFIWITNIMVVAITLRLIMLQICDGSIFYDKIIAPITLDILGIWIVICIDVIRNRRIFAVNIKFNLLKLCMWVSDTSYHVYIVHYFVLQGPYTVKYSNNIIIVKVILRYIILTFIAAILLKKVCNFIYKKIF